MLWIERLVLSWKISRCTLKTFEFRDLCDAYTAAEKGAEKLLRKQFSYGLTDEMLEYLKTSGSLVVKKLYTECTGMSL